MADLLNGPPIKKKRYPPSPFRDFLIELQKTPNQWFQYENAATKNTVSKGTVDNFRAGRSDLINPRFYTIITRNYKNGRVNAYAMYSPVAIMEPND